MQKSRWIFKRGTDELQKLYTNLNKIRLEKMHDQQCQKYTEITYGHEDSPLFTDIKYKWVHFLEDRLQFKKNEFIGSRHVIPEVRSTNYTSPGHQTSPMWGGYVRALLVKRHQSSPCKGPAQTVPAAITYTLQSFTEKHHTVLSLKIKTFLFSLILVQGKHFFLLSRLYLN